MLKFTIFGSLSQNTLSKRDNPAPYRSPLRSCSLLSVTLTLPRIQADPQVTPPQIGAHSSPIFQNSPYSGSVWVTKSPCLIKNSWSICPHMVSAKTSDNAIIQEIFWAFPDARDMIYSKTNTALFDNRTISVPAPWEGVFMPIENSCLIRYFRYYLLIQNLALHYSGLPMPPVF